jgi:glycine betaine/proline transport system substrate-binding protein
MRTLGRMMLVGALLAAPFGADHGAEAAEPTVVLGQVNLSFYAVTGAVIQQVLERLGHAVEVKEGPMK